MPKLTRKICGDGSNENIFQDELVAACHVHSFTYDFHLRMLSKYLLGRDHVGFTNIVCGAKIKVGDSAQEI